MAGQNGGDLSPLVRPHASAGAIASIRITSGCRSLGFHESLGIGWLRMKYLLPVFLPLLSAFGQTGQTAPTGVATPWDTTPMIASLSSQAARLRPILDQLTPKEWVAKGAPDAYIAQWKGAQDELGFLANSAKALEK